MLRATLPIAVEMRRRRVAHPWADEAWGAASVRLASADFRGARLLAEAADESRWLVGGVALELHRDEDEGYYENWAAPEPKVFVRWTLEADGSTRSGCRARPVLVSVSVAEGARMLDSGDPTDGVPMPPEIAAWLGRYLAQHYRPREHGRRGHG